MGIMEPKGKKKDEIRTPFENLSCVAETFDL